MKPLIKPPRLRKGDLIVTASLSGGMAGDAPFLWRYQQGKRRLEQEFGLRVQELPHTLQGSDYVYRNPKARAQELMAAFRDPAVRGIFSCIGGEESVRMLPYIDFDMIRRNPKIFMGYSDSTITHFMLRKAGVSSFYGASVLGEFGENVKMLPYTAGWVRKALFSGQVLGPVPTAAQWSGQYIGWTEDNKHREKEMQPNRGYESLLGTGRVEGRLLGGCMEVLEMIKGTQLWPEPDEFDGAILFFETSEEKPHPNFVRYWLRGYGTMGLLQRAAALVFGKPCQEAYYQEYKASILQVLRDELGLDIPVLYNATFGHNQPMAVLPMGALARVDGGEATFEILEAGAV